MTTGAGLIVSLVVAWTVALALYLFALDIRLVDYRWYRRLKGGTWRHPNGHVERYERRKAEVIKMSREWRKQQAASGE